MASSPILKASSLAPPSLSALRPLSHCVLHTLSLLPPSCKGPRDYIPPPQIIQENLRVLNLVTPAESLLLREATYSQAQGFEM